MTSILYTSTVLTLCLCFVAGIPELPTAHCEIGQCVPIDACTRIMTQLKEDTTVVSSILSKSYCGFDKATNTILVCCKTDDACITPEGTKGTCIDIQSCPRIMSMAQSRLKEHICQDADSIKVCCDLQLTSSPPSSAVGEEYPCHTVFPPDPSTNCCGIDASNGDDTIYGGNTTALDEYPWLALIEYSSYNNQTVLLCSGTLISAQYVLTAAHCIDGDVLLQGKPEKVRLGEYDISNPSHDCKIIAGGGEDCSEGAVSVPIEKIIKHSSYDVTSKQNWHDIGLIKLERIVKFSDFIRPICLPTVKFPTTSQKNVYLYAAGWGATEVRRSSDIKLKIRLPYVPIQTCQLSYGNSRELQLWEGQTCAGGELGKDSCSGDSGGALMWINKGQYELTGILSFGPSRCKTKGVPSVYTNVFKYLPWITRQIRDN